MKFRRKADSDGKMHKVLFLFEHKRFFPIFNLKIEVVFAIPYVSRFPYMQIAFTIGNFLSFFLLCRTILHGYLIVCTFFPTLYRCPFMQRAAHEVTQICITEFPTSGRHGGVPFVAIQRGE